MADHRTTERSIPGEFAGSQPTPLRRSARSQEEQLKRVTELKIKVEVSPHPNRKWAKSTMAMTEPLSSASNTRDSGGVGNRVATLNSNHAGRFVIAHLINEQFARPVGAGNFVPLTVAANGDHKNAIEKNLVNFLQAMKGTQGDKYNRMLKGNLQFGIFYEVTSADTFWDEDEFRDVPDYLDWHVELGIYDSTGEKQIDTDHDDLLEELKEFAEENFMPGINSPEGLGGKVNNRRYW